jgi:hypothetical protein
MSEVFATLPTTARSSRPTSPAGGLDDDLPNFVELDLVVEDRDVIRALVAIAGEEDRNRYALEALKIGVLALRHVGGQAMADLIHRASASLIREMQQTLSQHKEIVHGRLEASLREYFDPANGRFQERVKRLVSDDGELATLLKKQIDGENSQLTRTMLAHVGRESPLMKLLDPQQSEGILAELRRTVDGQLGQQRDHLLKEFSLDNKQGALARLVEELTTKHGNLTNSLQQKIDDVIKEFSLDREDSALSRLVRNVDRAQQTITSEFSLDSDTSCLSRLKKEIVDLLAQAETKNQRFQEEVKVTLATVIATRQEADRSPRHGLAFEDAVCEFLSREAQHAGDMAFPVGTTTGQIKNCKAGDCVIELGPDSAAPGARIAVEAKEKAGYSLANAREEIETARKNRDADWGIFVFSKKSAPAALEPFQRFGNDFVVIWDAEDPSQDVFLKAGVIAARALCFRAERQTAAQKVDFEAIDKAILEIERRAQNLDEVRKAAETIQASSAKILDRIRIDRDVLEKQVATLRDRTADLKLLGSPSE